MQQSALLRHCFIVLNKQINQKTEVGLTGVKRRFTEITVQQIQQFQRKLEKFDEEFHVSGPGTVGSDLDSGVEIMKMFRKLLQQYEEDKFVVETVI